MKKTKEYADIIMRDDLSMIAAEQTIVYESDRIERLYKFHDGAIVRYEWQGIGENRTVTGEVFNHRFSLVEPPEPNPHGFKRGVITTVNYPS